MTDLESAARAFHARDGRAAAGGGRHPGWGTANRVVPLGDAYLELVAVVDPDEARRSPFGRWVAASSGSLVPLGWAVRTDRIDDLSHRLALDVADGSRVTTDGDVVRWRLAGVERAAAEPTLPFFIEWRRGTPHPGQAVANHPAGRARIESLELAGDEGRLTEWLGPHEMPVSVQLGDPAVRRVVVSTESGTAVVAASAD